MKKISTIIFLLLIKFTFGQTTSLQLSNSRTTSLIFPFPVKYVDRGSKEILVQQVKGADNILLVKASGPGLQQTNLTVITGEGTVYSFRVNFGENPLNLVWEVPAQHEANVSTYANSILDNPPVIHTIHKANFDIFARVSGIYIREKTIYYQLQILNRSTIDYDIDHLRFIIRDRRRWKRNATQEVELQPVYIAGNTRLVKAGDANSIVIALPKFTIPDQKILEIKIGEQNGGRNLSMHVHNRNIIRAVRLSELK